MWITTHLLIAQKTYQCLPSYLKNKIDLQSFMYGNVKPDLDYSLSSISHCFQDSFPFIHDEIKSLQKQERNCAEYSIKLGVINHFLSDFFCSAHYAHERFEGIVQHLSYEFQVHHTFKKLERENMLSPSMLSTDTPVEDNLCDTIKSLEAKFSRLQDSNEKNDIHFALRACNFTNKCLLTYAELKIFNPYHKGSKQIVHAKTGV